MSDCRNGVAGKGADFRSKKDFKATMTSNVTFERLLAKLWSGHGFSVVQAHSNTETNQTITVDYCLIGTWFNSISDLAARIPWSQIFIGFYNINFSWFNNTWFNSQTWFTGAIFWSHWKTIPNLKADLIKFIINFLLSFHF